MTLILHLVGNILRYKNLSIQGLPSLQKEMTYRERQPLTVLSDNNLFKTKKEIDWLDVHTNGRPKDTAINLGLLLQELNFQVVFNEMMRDMQIIMPNKQFISSIENDQKMAFIISACNEHNLSTKNLDKYLSLLASPYHPVKDWIESKEWDGKDRISLLMSALGSISDTSKELFYKHSLYSVACLYKDNISADGFICFVGKQGLGKTQFVKSLAPSEYVYVSAQLNPENKDQVHQCCRSWLCELGEVDKTTRHADISALKAFITKPIDEYRLPYHKEPQNFPRRTAFFGTVNNKDFLRDKTGNRRFWVIEPTELNWEHGIDMQQYWAQIKKDFDKGESWHLDDKTIVSINQQNDKYTRKSDIEERLEEFLEGNSKLISFNWNAHYSYMEVLGWLNLEKASQLEKQDLVNYMDTRYGERKSYGGKQSWHVIKEA